MYNESRGKNRGVHGDSSFMLGEVSPSSENLLSKNAIKKTNTTTNYALDSHTAFCKRCRKAHEGNCPRTGTKVLDKRCRL